jgi:hypothetical protein
MVGCPRARPEPQKVNNPFGTNRTFKLSLWDLDTNG